MLWNRRASSQAGRMRVDPGGRQARNPQAAVWHYDGGAIAAGRLAPRARGDARGYGGHGGVLEAGVAPARRAIRVAAGEPDAGEGATGKEDGPERRGTDRRFSAARVIARQLRAIATDAAVARSHAEPDAAEAGTGADQQSDSEGAGRRQYQAEHGGIQHDGGQRASDDQGDREREVGCGGVGGDGTRATAWKDPRIKGGGGGPADGASPIPIGAMAGHVG